MAKTELEEAGEDTEGMVDSTAKMRKDILGLTGVDIMINENTFKNTYQTISEIQKVWGDLSDIDRANCKPVCTVMCINNIFNCR